MSGDTLNLVLAVVTLVLGAAISYYFYRISKKERRPVYFVTGNVVVRGDEKRNIEVRFKGEVVPAVTRTVVAFWNAGREPIRRDDIVKRHPLFVRLPDDTEVLEAKVIATTRPEIDFHCFPDDELHDVNLEFSHLNHQDGGAIEILHTGDTPRRLGMKGAIVGVDGPPRLKASTGDEWVPTSRPLVFMILIVLTALMALVVIREVEIEGPIWLAALVPAYWVLLGLGALVQRRRAKTAIPAALRDALGLPPI